MRAGYRASQFWKALTPVSDQNGLALAEKILSPSLLALFMKMQAAEMNHSLQVTRKLISAGETHPDLLSAALLHDAGKCRLPIHLWERVLIVLVRNTIPRVYLRWSKSDNLKTWKHMFVVAEHHPAWGAEMAEEAGASPLLVDLILRHQQPPIPVTRDELESGARTLEDYLLFQLQLFDEES